jgi:putrescine aminotransferase
MFINLDDMENLTEGQKDELYRRNFNNTLYVLFKLANMDIHFVRASGNYLWDSEGSRYIDFTAGFGALNLGHNPEGVINSLIKHFSSPNISEQSINHYNAVLANNISYLTEGKLPVCHFFSSGAETVDEALKLAQMYRKSGDIVYCCNAYHGKTLGAISALGDSAKKNYQVFEKSFIEIPFGEYDALVEASKKREIAAFLVEPVQAEAGVIVPDEDYFIKVRKFCDREDIVLILDEIQTGLGRCGTMFCYEQLKIIPDILCLAKSLSGGVMPIGCIAVKEKLWDATYGKLKNASLPSTTFGGNTFSSVAGIAALSLIRDNRLHEKSQELGSYALRQLEEMAKKHEMITDVRGKGLLIGIEFGSLKKFPGKMITEFMMSSIISRMLRDYKIVCGFSVNNPAVLKFEPALIISKDEIDYFIESLDNLLRDEAGTLSLAMNSLKNAAAGAVDLLTGGQ